MDSSGGDDDYDERPIADGTGRRKAALLPGFKYLSDFGVV
jgi:hypothetical protein